MPDTILGLPLHPLVVHAVVVFVPLAAAGFLAIAAVRRWRRPYGLLVVLAATIAAASTPVATSTGETLRDSLAVGGAVADTVAQHQEWGERLIWLMVPLWASSVLLVLLDRRARPGVAATVVAVVGALAALGAVGVVLRTGHLGATAVWNPGG